jgi:hypothetical protein
MMDTILIATLTVLAGKWQQQADSDMVTASAKGRRQVEVLDIASLYYRAVKERVAAERAAKKKARKK